MNRKSDDANKGMDTNRYMWAVLIAIILMITTAILFVGKEKTKVVPHAVEKSRPQPHLHSERLGYS